MAEKWATITDRSCEFIIFNPIRIFKMLNSVDLRGQAADILAAIDRTIEELQKVHSTVLSELSQ